MYVLTSITRLVRCHRIITQNPSIARLLLVKSLHKEPIPVAWEKPKIGWTKLNFDGSSKGKTGEASIGGVFRDHNAKFMLGYAESIGRSDSTIAELAALLRGLEIILENGWDDVWLEGDAKALVNIITKRRSMRSLEAQKYISYINAIIPELNNYTMSHIYREGNRVADKFAQIGHQLETPCIWRHAPPDEVLPIMHEDAEGKIILRRR
ncbi:hypothetical protein BVRB_015560 [Beta vulgaris subsp. vulgaris]|uniref:RNase H type-1 domain-containing protein n=1 Tax=Beta vulgaris subsp. vulgaris TaxID=3555 RepID=A0A0J8B4H6_BETVV|nr:hypothetical protein BVRB_015560 [Beta vulgaris subsp. vulgaris]